MWNGWKGFVTLCSWFRLSVHSKVCGTRVLFTKMEYGATTLGWNVCAISLVNPCCRIVSVQEQDIFADWEFYPDKNNNVTPHHHSVTCHQFNIIHAPTKRGLPYAHTPITRVYPRLNPIYKGIPNPVFKGIPNSPPRLQGYNQPHLQGHTLTRTPFIRVYPCNWG